MSLKEAREKAAEGRALVKAGVDPLAEWNKPDQEEVPTFGKMADDFVEAHKGGWRNDKHDAQWAMTLTTYCEPIRKLPVDAIDTEAVLSVLKPLWRGRRKPPRASAAASSSVGRGQGARPSAQRSQSGAMARPSRQALPKRPKLTRGHHAAMPYADVPAFVASLRERPATAARALEFCILTAARSGEALAARWDEIDLDAKVWTVPPARMKAAREHRVPLSDRALAILARNEGRAAGDYVFPGQRPGRPLSVMAIEMSCAAWASPCTAHGFRSSFRDWAATKRISRANSPSTRWRMSSATKPNKRTGDPTRWRGGGSLWRHGRGIARRRPAKTSWHSSGRHSCAC